MLLIIIETFAPLLSLFLFILGAGFFSTLLALDMTLNQASPFMIGSLTGLFYAGIVIGTFRVEKFITRLGHIRAYSVFSATLAIICLLHGLIYNEWLWLFLRFVAGAATAGLYVVIESWLLCKSTHVNRGRVLALYMITFYAAQSLGQFILKAGNPEGMMLFAITSMLCSLSIIPLSMTHVRSPQYDEPSTLGLKALVSTSPTGVIGCLSAGMIMGTLYGLMPSFLSNLFHSKAAIANYMFAIIMGGMLLQFPVGKLSDIFERRLVLIIVSMATIAVSLAIILVKHQMGWYFFMLMSLLGGLTFTLYPISITQACESLDTKDLVAGTQGLLLIYSIGAMIGPMVAPALIGFAGENGIFFFFILVSACTIPILILRKAQGSADIQEESIMYMPQTSPILLELDPRSDESDELGEDKNEQPQNTSIKDMIEAAE
jgi:MFS family permease